MWGEFTFWPTRDSSQYCDSGPSMSNCPLSGQQAMLRPQWRGDPSQAAAFPYLARLQNVSAQKAYAERLQEDRERAGLQPLPPCHWRVP